MSNNLINSKYSYRSFKDISYDSDNKVYLVSSEVEAIDFDEFVQNLEINTYKSVDAIYEDDKRLYLIEFKNISIYSKNPDKRAFKNREAKITEKYKDSITLILNKQQVDKKVRLLLVVSTEKNKNNRKRMRSKIYEYKKKLYYYVNLITVHDLDNVNNVPFTIVTDKEFDGYFKA